MPVRCKEGVAFAMVAPAGFAILAALKAIGKAFPRPVTITAGTDGKHAKTSRHYTGEAYDVRSKDMTAEEKELFLVHLEAKLGKKRFYYFLESAGTDNEHWHIQKKAGTVYTVNEFLDEGNV